VRDCMQIEGEDGEERLILYLPAQLDLGCQGLHEHADIFTVAGHALHAIQTIRNALDSRKFVSRREQCEQEFL
jgi:hypothetical protein